MNTAEILLDAASVSSGCCGSIFSMALGRTSAAFVPSVGYPVGRRLMLVLQHSSRTRTFPESATLTKMIFPALVRCASCQLHSLFTSSKQTASDFHLVAHCCLLRLARALMHESVQNVEGCSAWLVNARGPDDVVRMEWHRRSSSPRGRGWNWMSFLGQRFVGDKLIDAVFVEHVNDLEVSC